jgi:uncharacterized repeat protein (TIGR03803 family)
MALDVKGRLKDGPLIVLVLIVVVMVLAALVIFVMPDERSGNYAVLHHFSASDGAGPNGIALLGNGTGIIGSASAGGQYGQGTVYRIGENAFTLLRICDANGSNPAQGPVASVDNARLFGLTTDGGDLGAGTAYTMFVNGSGWMRLASFGGSNGSGPVAAPALSGDGTQLYCALGQSGLGYGTIVSVDSASGAISVLYRFAGGSDGALPYSPLLLSEDNSHLYGMTYSGGNGYGTVFRVGTNGSDYRVLHAFTGSDGANPRLGGLCLDSHGTLYGTTSSGGLNGQGTVFSLHDDGSNFTVLHSFAGKDGSIPLSTLVYNNATHLFYGTASQGGSGYGTLFQMSGDGSNFSVLFNFISTFGSMPTGPLLVDEKGKTLYGVATAGGANGLGVLYAYGLSSGGH